MRMTTSLSAWTAAATLGASMTLCFGPGGSATAATSSTTAATAMETAASADEQFDRLQRRFDRLFRALQSLGGLSDVERPLIEDLRDDFAAFNQQHPEHLRGLIGELQLSMWLADSDRVDELFERLLTREPENVEFGKAWTRYAEREYDLPRVEQVYRRLFDRFPDNVELRISRAEQLKQRNQYHRALETLREIELDPTEHPRAYLLMAECLFAEHRFEEALATIRQIPEFALLNDRILTRQVEDKQLLIQEYIRFWEEEQELRDAEASVDDLPRVQLNTERGVIILELFENEAPNTVANFITLVEDGYYDGTRFHRVINNFMAQGGDPNTKDDVDGIHGQGGPGYRIADEHTRPDHRKHFSGSLSMANTGARHTGGSQFFLTHEPTAHLNGRHTVFGRVLEGLDVVRTIERNDLLESAVVLRKRDHEYDVQKLIGDEMPEEPALPAPGADDEPIFSPGRLQPDAPPTAEDDEPIFSPSRQQQPPQDD
jgi:cyclophilin family peptidyl-prolyl cis-trans isomerase